MEHLEKYGVGGVWNLMVSSGDLLNPGREMFASDVVAKLFETLSDGVCFLDHDLRVVYANDSAARYLRSSQAALHGSTLWDVHPSLQGARLENEIQKSARTRVPTRCSYIFPDEPGGEIEIRAHPIPEGILLFVLNISAQRRVLDDASVTDERVHRIIDTAPVFISYVDSGFRFLLVNQHYVEIFKRPREELIGLAVREVLGDVLWNTVAPHYERAMKGEQVSFHFDAEFEGLGARSMYARYTPDVDTQGMVRGIMTVVRDITDQIRAEQLLKESDRRKDEFLATLAHELRNPLASLSNALHILPRVEDQPERVAHLREIMGRQVGQLRRLIDDLLDVSRISRGKIELRRQATDLISIVHEALESVAPAIEAHKHTLECDMPGHSLAFYGDHGRLVQVFGNLIQNASKYTPSGGRISIRLDQEDEDFIVRVRDTGLGIPNSMLNSIFEPFTQINQSLDRAQGGLGIGLTLVKSIVEMHGGAVQVRSDGAEQGSEFTVRLPRTPVEARECSLSEPSLDSLRCATNRCRVLVVDDVKESGDTLAMILEQLGHDVRTVYDGHSALRATVDFAPDVVISDIAMPGMDGYTLAEKLRGLERPPYLLVALTGYGQKHDRHRALEAGFNLHLVKPVSMKSLGDVLFIAKRVAADAHAL